MDFSKAFKSLQFLKVQGSLNPNITFLSEKLWPVAWNKKYTNKEKNRKMPIIAKKLFSCPKITPPQN